MMNFKPRLAIGLWAFVCATLLGGAAMARPLENDARIRTGKLDNGVTWKYRQHDNPPGKMWLLMHVDTGSLNETDDQRGLAHFIEHMCFNGTENFPPGELIKYFESIGMEFGADLNAFTSFDQTAYMLFTPDTEHEQIDKALMVLSDYAFRVSMIPEEIEKERGVVLEESRSGKNAFQRIRDKLWPELFEGSRFAQRLPIGKEDIIANAPPKQFIDYYRTWYRPENITVFMVGDAAPEPYIPMIKKWFGEHKSKSTERKDKGPGFVPFTRQRAMVVTDAEMAFCNVDLWNIRPGRPPTTTSEQWRTELIENIGTWIVGRRYEERVNKGTASFRRANVSVGNFFQDALIINGTASGEPADWNRMLDEVIDEVHRVQEHGFTRRELDLAKKELLADAERAVKTEPTLDARRIAFAMLFATNDEEPVLSAQQELDLYNQLLPSVQLSEINTAFKEHFQPGKFAYVVTMVEKDGVTVPSRDDVLAAARAAWARKVDPIQEDAAPTSLLASMPTPGKVVDRSVDADLNITSAWLSNGVRVHHRFMDYKKDTVMVTISLAGGPIEETPQNAGVSEVAAIAINEAATHRLTSTNIRDIMTGVNIGVRAGAAGDVLKISVSGSPEDLEMGLQEVHALMTEGIIEESAFKNWKLQTNQFLDMVSKMPRFKATEAMMELLSGGDPRLTLMTKKKIDAQSLGGAQKWFDRLCREAPIEVSIVGDIQLDVAMPLIEKYIGSLPKRNRTAEHLDKLRKLPRSTGPLTKRVDVDTVTPQAMAIVGFYACEGKNVTDRRALDIASEILTSRLIKRVREDLSIVYSIRARNQPSWRYDDSGMFVAGAPCDPENVDRVADEVHTMFQAFAKDGPTDEELSNAKKQIANNLDTEMREPSYWSGILSHHDLHHRDLNEEKREKAAFERFTGDQVRAAFAKYYKPTRQFRVTAIPTKVEAKKEPATTP